MMSPPEIEQQPHKNVEANQNEDGCSEFIKLGAHNQELKSILEKEDSLAALPASISDIIQECILKIFSMYQEALQFSHVHNTSLSEEQDINLDTESSKTCMQGQDLQKLHEKLIHHYNTFTKKSFNNDMNTGGTSTSSALDTLMKNQVKALLECYEKSFTQIEKSVCKFLHGLNDKCTLPELESVFSIFPKSFQNEWRGELPIQSCVQSIKSVKWLPALLKFTFPNQDENENKQILKEIRIFGSKAILDVKCLKLGENGIMRRFNPIKMHDLNTEDLSYTILEYLFVSKPSLFDADETFITRYEMDYDNVYFGVIQDLHEKGYISQKDIHSIFSSIGGVMNRDKERRYRRRIKFLWNTVRIINHEDESTFHDLLEVSSLTPNGNADWLQKVIENPNKAYRLYKTRERRRKEMNSSLSKVKLPKQKKQKMLDNSSQQLKKTNETWQQRTTTTNTADVSGSKKLSPAVSSASSKVSRRQCFASHCTNTRSLRKCLGCNIAAYCSIDCQKSDWKFHQSFCISKQDTAKASSEDENANTDSNQAVSSIPSPEEGTQNEERNTENVSSIDSQPQEVSIHNASHEKSILASSNGRGDERSSKPKDNLKASSENGNTYKDSNQTVSNIPLAKDGTQSEQRTAGKASSTHSQPQAVSIHTAPHANSILASNIKKTGNTMPSKAANTVSLPQKQQFQQNSMNHTSLHTAHMASNTRIGRHQPNFVDTIIMKSTGKCCSYPPCQVMNGLMKCGGCNIASYCSAHCQSCHWPIHQKTCLSQQHEGKGNSVSTQQLQHTQTNAQIPTQQHNSLHGSYPLHHQQYQQPYQQPIYPYQYWNMHQQQHFVSNSSLNRSYHHQQQQQHHHQQRQSIPLKNNGANSSKTTFSQTNKSKRKVNAKKAPNSRRASNQMPLKRKATTEIESTQKKSRLETNGTSSLIHDREANNDSATSILSITKSTFSDIDLTKYGKYFSYIGSFILKDFIDEETNEASTFRGQIEYIYMGQASANSKEKELLFHVQYSDGDTEDLTLDEVEDCINDYKARGDCTQNNDSGGNEMTETEDSKDVEVDQDLFQAIQTAAKVAVDKRKSLSKANKENQPSNGDIAALPRTETWEDDDDDDDDEVDNENNGEVSNVYFDYSDLSQDEDELEEDDGDVVAQNVYDDEGVSDYNDDGVEESEEESYK